MSMERPEVPEPGPSREELRQVSKSKPTGEFAGASPTQHDIEQRAEADREVAEFRARRGLEPELSDRHGVGDERRVPEGEATKFDGFGGAVLAPRSAYAARETEFRVPRIEAWNKTLALARTIGIDLPDSNPPDKDDPDFNHKFNEIQQDAAWRIDQYYENFGKALKNDTEISKLIKDLRDAESAEREATSGSYGELLDRKLWPLRLNLSPKNIFYSAWLNFAGGSSIVDRGQEAIKKAEEVREKIVSLVCKKFQEAGLNSGLRTEVEPENTNQGRVERILGISIIRRF